MRPPSPIARSKQPSRACSPPSARRSDAIAAAHAEAAAIAERSRAEARALAERTQRRMRRLRAAFERRTEAELAALQLQAEALAAPQPPDAGDDARVVERAVARLAAELTGGRPVIAAGSLEYAHARIWARHGQRPDEGWWRRIETTREPARAARTGARHAAGGLARRRRAGGRHARDRAGDAPPLARARGRGRGLDAAGLGPALSPGAPCSSTCRRCSTWPAAAPRCPGWPTIPRCAAWTTAAAGTPIRLRAAARCGAGRPAAPAAAVARAWQQRLPRTAHGRRGLKRAAAPARDHAAAFGAPQAVDGWALRRRLQARLVLLLRRSAGRAGDGLHLPGAVGTGFRARARRAPAARVVSEAFAGRHDPAPPRPLVRAPGGARRRHGCAGGARRHRRRRTGDATGRRGRRSSFDDLRPLLQQFGELSLRYRAYWPTDGLQPRRSRRRRR